MNESRAPRYLKRLRPRRGANRGWLDRAATWLNIGFAPLALAPIVVSLFFSDRISPDSGNIVAVWALTATTFFLFLVVAIVFRAYYKLRRSHDQVRGRENAYVSIANTICSLSAQRTGILEHIVNYRANKNRDSSQLRHKIETFLDLTLNHVCTIFNLYTGSRCACAIKMIRRHDPFDRETLASLPPEQHVRTLIRDMASRSERSKADAFNEHKSYSFLRNTASREIMLNENADGYWYCNDLVSYPNYENANPLWKTFYNATAVVAIKKPGTLANETAIGFFGVDNMDGGFDSKFTKYILEAIAYVLYYILSSLWAIEKET